MLRVSLIAAATHGAASFAVGAGTRATHARASMPAMSFFDFSATTIDGAECSMESFKGKPTLILNVASL
jgi:hypothetical protein